MPVTPIQLTAAPADKPAPGPARTGKPSASQFAHLLGGTRTAAHLSREQGADAPGTNTGTSTAKLMPDTGQTRHAGNQPLAAHTKEAGNEAGENTDSLAALTLPAHLPAMAGRQSATRTNAGSGSAQTAIPGPTQPSDTSHPLKLAGRTLPAAPGQSPATEPGDARALRVVARLAGGQLVAATPTPDTTTAAPSAKRIEALFSTTTAAPSADSGPVALGAAANPSVIRRALDVVAAGAAQKTERTASTKTDPTVLVAHSPAAHTGSPNSGTPTSAPMPPALPVLNQPVGDPSWNQALAQQSLRLHHAGAGRAELQLHPKDLGTLQISLQMGEQAQVHISSPHAHVRAAVENALPQLRQAFADSGIALGDTSVGDQSTHQGQGFDQDQRPGQPVLSEPVAEIAGPAGTSAVTVLAGPLARSGIDLYA